MKNNGVIVIGGPTASGKSGLAIDLAAALDGEIINADSMQVYKDIPILSAVPDENERKNIPHWLFEIYESDFRGNVVDWLDLCVAKIKDIRQKGKVPVVVGGTGMYLQNLISGTTPIPPTDEKIRENLKREFAVNSLSFMYKKLQNVDKVTAEKLSPNDKTRIMRALEVFESSGVKISDWYEKPMIKMLPEADFFFIKILPNISELENNCRVRFDKMVKIGALDEVKNLLSKNIDADSPAMKALGVPELMDYLKGKISIAEAVELAKLHTRQYAKRQLTWFRNQMTADFEIKNCYRGEKNIVDDIKKAIQNPCRKKD